MHFLTLCCVSFNALTSALTRFLRGRDTAQMCFEDLPGETRRFGIQARAWGGCLPSWGGWDLAKRAQGQPKDIAGVCSQ